MFYNHYKIILEIQAMESRMNTIKYDSVNDLGDTLFAMCEAAERALDATARGIRDLDDRNELKEIAAEKAAARKEAT